MKDILNYAIHFIGGDIRYVTSEQASAIEAAWIGGVGAVRIGDSTYACHQITRIERDVPKEKEQIRKLFGVILDALYFDYDPQKAKVFMDQNEKFLKMNDPKTGKYLPAKI